MTVYVQLSVERIQAYLARTESLAGRRAASSMVIDMFADGQITAAPGFEAAEFPFDDEPDGKRTCRLPAEPSQHERRQLVSRLVREAPGAPLALRIVHASDDSAALEKLHSAVPDVRSLPACADNPFGRPCELCGVDLAERTETIDNKKVSLCRDCSKRSRGRRDSRTRLESQLSDDFEGAKVPDDMNALAELGRDRRGINNHVATVFVDGNRLGAVFSAVKTHALETSQSDLMYAVRRSAEVSKRIGAAIKVGLGDATREIFDPTTRKLPVIPHVVGGDDILVSVPASLALPFVRVLMSTIDAHINCEDGSVVAGLPEARFYSGAGVVISQASYPFRALVTLVEEQCSLAKKDWAGEVSAVSFLDLTADGPRRPPGRYSWPIAWLNAMWDDLDQVANIQPSARSELRRIVTDNSVHPSDRRQFLREFQRRTKTQLPTRFSAAIVGAWPQPHPSTELSQANLDTDGMRVQLFDDVLAMTKRWPKSEHSNPTTAEEA